MKLFALNASSGLGRRIVEALATGDLVQLQIRVAEFRAPQLSPHVVQAALQPRYIVAGRRQVRKIQAWCV